MKYTIRDREAGNPIEDFDTLEEAEIKLEEYEKSDKNEGIYTPNFYEIVKNEDL